MVVGVPDEVWFHIASFLSYDELCNLYTVNHAFFQAAIIALYEAITFPKVNRQTKHLCAFLSDPTRGDCVRSVDIKPCLIKPRTQVPRTYHQRAWNAILKLFDPQLIQRRMNQQGKKRMEKDIDRVSQAVRGFRNLTEYSLSWDGASLSQLENCQAFLRPVLTHINHRIVKLSLDIPTGSLRCLANISMPRLRHFELGLCTLELQQQEINEIFDHLLVFINNLDRTLVSLSVSSRRSSLNLDLARAFTHLGTFPRLQKFSLTIPYDGRHLSSPSELVRFFEKHHDTLHDLQLGANPSSPANSPTPAASKDWIYNILAATTTPYPCLSAVTLALRPLRANLMPVIKFLAQHAGQLEHLHLTDRALEYGELEAILHGLGAHARLKCFKVRLSCLNSAFLGLLALHLPQLASLELTFSEVKAFAAPGDFEGDTTARVLRELELFEDEVRGNRAEYVQWKLNTIGVSYSRPSGVYQSIHEDHLSILSRALLDSIPALLDVIQLEPLHDH